MLETLTRREILKAIEDCAARGRDGFLEHHRAKRRRAKTYFICHRGDEYDLKAIAYVALLPRSEGRPLAHSPRVAEAVADLGFTVIHTGEAPSPEGPVPPVESSEGKKIWRIQKKRERGRQLAAAAIERNKERNDGWIKCEACGLADRVRSMFDAHHRRPLAAGERVTNVNDIAVLCPNCHRWAHVKVANRLSPLSIDEVARARRNRH